MSTPPAVLITGSATRVGAAIAKGFARDGWHVIIHHLSSDEEAEDLASTLPSAETYQCDLSNDAEAVEMVERLAARLPGFRCLINSASIFRYDDATKLDPETNRESMQVNALTPARMSQAFFENVASDQCPCVIQITDMKLENPNPDFFSYTMSKHAIASTIAMLAEANPNARVYGVAPGAILASHDQSEEETEVSHRLNLLKRKTGADEVADAAVFLASGALASGTSLFVDSGQHLLNQPRDVIYLAREKVDEA